MNYQTWSKKQFWAIFILVFFLGWVLAPRGTVTKEVVKEAPRATVKEVVVTATPSATVQPTVVAVNRMPDSMRKIYLDNCVTPTTTLKYCDCTLTELEKAYTFAEIATMGNQYNVDGKIPTARMDAALKCVDKL